MKEEKQRVIEYLDRKKETENLEDIGKFWRKMEEKVEKKEAQTRRLENLEMEKTLIGWSSWWNKMELEAETENRKKKVERKKKESFSTIKLPNQVLVGWKGWWDRVEADGKREGKKPEKNNSWSRNRSNRIMKDHFIKKYFSEPKEEKPFNDESRTEKDLEEVKLKGGQVTPKRKFTFKTYSVEKKAKITFPENIQTNERTNRQSHAQSADFLSNDVTNNKGEGSGYLAGQYSQHPEKLLVLVTDMEKPWRQWSGYSHT